MFNEKQKQRYIEYKEAQTVVADNYLKRIFGYAEDMETVLNKDLSLFTGYEIITLYKTLNRKSLESLIVINSYLSMYVQWCLEQNLVPDGQNHYLEMNQDTLFSCLNKILFNKSIISLEELVSLIRVLPNAREQFSILFIFELSKNKDYMELSHAMISQFNDKDKTFTKQNGDVVKISDALLHYAHEAEEELTIRSTSQKGIRVSPVVKTSYIYKYAGNAKDGASDFMKGRRIYTAMLKALKFLGVKEWIDPNTLVASGKIHMIKKLAREHNISPIEVLDDRSLLKEVEERYECSITPSIFKRRYYEFLI